VRGRRVWQESLRLRDGTRARSGFETSSIQLVSSTVQVLITSLCYGILNYDEFDLTINDIRSGINFFDQLSRTLQKVTFLLDERENANRRSEGFAHVHHSIKGEARRVTKTLVDTPGEQYEEAVVCRQHGTAPEACRCETKELVWRFTATSAAYRRAKQL
jgi:hypothetical protein